MSTKITYRHLESCQSIDQRIKEKMEHIKQLSNKEIEAHWICSSEKNRFKAEVNIHYGHNHFHAEDETDNLHTSINNITRKISRQINSNTTQVKDHIHRKN